MRARLERLVDGLSAPLRDTVRGLVERPGKQLRSTMLAACAGFGEADPGRVARLGAVVELVHLASLVHDDVIDRAAVRRGRPAAHREAGTELALLAGLACLGAAGAEAAELGEDVSVPVSRTIAELTHGELLDVERGFDVTLSLPDYVELVRRKTGALFELSCLLGAAEARLGRPARTALAAFGREFGIAFQIMDDCWDLTAAGADKPVGTDQLLGLFGAPTLSALRADDSGRLGELLLSPGFSVADLAEVRELVTGLGGITAARELAGVHYRKALSALAAAPGRPAGAALRAIAEKVWGEP
ncbi:polyprenyl synthetase family protein [Amycolatopsis samaneae]